jgi:hypothetical protein
MWPSCAKALMCLPPHANSTALPVSTKALQLTRHLNFLNPIEKIHSPIAIQNRSL